MASPPLYVTIPPRADVLRGEGPQVRRFFEERCRITKQSLGGRAGDLIELRNWQVNLNAMLYARREDGRRRHRRALVGLPRKNGKSAVGSGHGLYALLWSGDGAEVYSAAADKDQAKIVFGVAKRMVELDPQLSKIVRVFRDVLEVPETGSIYRALSSEAFTKEGLSPSCVLFDELHAQPNDELWDVLSNASGARVDPLLIAITTAGVKTDITGNDSICYRLYKYGVDIASGVEIDPSFFFAWWGAKEGSDPSLPETWEAANPGYGDLLDAEDFEATYRQAVAKGTINDFKTKRLNMWVSTSQAWLPDGWWNKCATLAGGDWTEPAKGVVLGFDGSRNGDATALVACTVEHEPKLKVLGLWERPLDKSLDWSVPRGEVKDVIRRACREMNVVECAYDEFLWQDAFDELSEEIKRRDGEELFVAYPQTTGRMSPATQRLYELVQTQKIRHTGDPRLARHIANAQVKTDERGSRIVKDARHSARKIDLAVASVMAVDRAAFWNSQDGPGTFRGVPVGQIRFVWLAVSGESARRSAFASADTALRRKNLTNSLHLKTALALSAALLAFDGLLTTITERTKCVAFYAYIATRRSASLKTLQRFCARAFHIWSARTVANFAKTAAQIAGIGVISYGIGLIYIPAALIFVGLVLVAALEIR